MAPSTHAIILASARPELQELKPPLEEAGWEVHLCSDGAKALQLALRLFPPLMLVDSDVPLLPGEKLAQILRANPRTEGTGFFFIGREGEEIEGFRRHTDQFLVRPFNREQLLLAIHAFRSRRERTEQVGRFDREVAGSLDQISLVDLLQVFGLNRKDGVLTLTRGEEKATVYLLEGCVVNARVGRVSGEKAFFRLLRWEQGQFWFAPGAPEVEAKIACPLDHLLMEGMRQNDEERAQQDSLPAPGTRLALRIPRERLPRGLRPTTQEVLLLLEYYQRVADILDHCPRPDFEVLQVLRVLLEKGLVEEIEEVQPAEAAAPLLTSEEVLAVKDTYNEGATLLETATAKVILLATEPAPVRDFLDAVQGLPEFRPAGEALLGSDRLPLGDIGLLLVGETFALRLFILPAGAETAPLWTSFGRRLFGVAALGASTEMNRAIDFFETQAHIPVARIVKPGAGASGFVLEAGNRQGLRRLLAFFATRFRGEAAQEEES